MKLGKIYLGDAVYADVSEDEIILTTEDGVSVSNTIVLEPYVLEQLLKVLGLTYGGK